MACELGDGLALLDHDSGQFFILDEVGSFIWKLLSAPATADELAEAVKRTFDAAPEAVDEDIRDFVRDMIDARLFEATQR